MGIDILDLNNLSNNTILELREFGKEIGVKRNQVQSRAVDWFRPGLRNVKIRWFAWEKGAEAKRWEAGCSVRKAGEKTPVIDAEKQKAEETKTPSWYRRMNPETVQGYCRGNTRIEQKQLTAVNRKNSTGGIKKGSYGSTTTLQPSHTRAAEQQRCRRCLGYWNLPDGYDFFVQKLYAGNKDLYITISDQALQPQDRDL